MRQHLAQTNLDWRPPAHLTLIASRQRSYLAAAKPAVMTSRLLEPGSAPASANPQPAGGSCRSATAAVPGLGLTQANADSKQSPRHRRSKKRRRCHARSALPLGFAIHPVIHSVIEAPQHAPGLKPNQPKPPNAAGLYSNLRHQHERP